MQLNGSTASPRRSQAVRDARVARALQIRIGGVDQELIDLEDERDWHIARANECDHYIGELVTVRFQLVAALWRTQSRRLAAAFKRHRLKMGGAI